MIQGQRKGERQGSWRRKRVWLEGKQEQGGGSQADEDKESKRTRIMEETREQGRERGTKTRKGRRMTLSRFY